MNTPFSHRARLLGLLGALALSACSQSDLQPSAGLASQAAPGFYVSNGKLLDPNGVPFIFQGINHPHSWYTTTTRDALPAMRSRGANSVRIVLSSGCRGWYKSPASEVTELINQAKAQQMIAVLEVHDTTGYGEDSSACSLDNAVNYWLEVKNALIGQEAYAILNIGNEPYGNQNTGNWAPATKAAIAKLRAAGIKNTLMIDGPNWGQDWSNTMRQTALDIFNSDPHKNLIFSIHMYEVYNTASKVNEYLDAFVTAKLPLVVGEFANTHKGQFVDAATIMSASKSKVNGYLGWSWSGNGGGVEALDMVNSFNPASPTSWGNMIFNDLKTAKVATHFGTPPTGTVTKTGENCTDFHTIRVGSYLYVNNTWGSSKTGGQPYKQCLQTGTLNGQTVYGWNWNWPGYEPTVYAYPEIVYGYKPWDTMTSTDPRFPMKVSTMPNVQMTWEVEGSRTGHYDFAPEIWFTSTPGDGAARPQDITTEIMIWLDYDSSATPAGSKVATTVIDGVSYDLYKARISGGGATWDYLAYKGPPGRNAGSVSITKFAKDAVARGYASGEHYMSGVEFGDESSGGTGNIWVKKYEIAVGSVNQPPGVSISSPTQGQSFPPNTPITVKGTATDPDGTVTRVELLVNGTLYATDTTPPYEFNLTTLPTGTHTLTLKATDNLGATRSDTRTITVTGSNTPPSLTVSSPTEGQTFPAGTTVNVAASATDADGISKVDFYVDGTLKLSDTTSPYSYSAAGLTSGNHTVKVVAFDRTGLSSTVSRNFTVGSVASTCKVVYSKQNDWGTGATIHIDITNTSSTAVSNWTLSWTFAGNERVRDFWNGVFTQSGQGVTVKPLSWNSTIAAGGTVQVGFNLEYSGSTSVPATFLLNGKTCSR